MLLEKQMKKSLFDEQRVVVDRINGCETVDCFDLDCEELTGGYQLESLRNVVSEIRDRRKRIVMTENFDWDIYPVCESDETYTLEVYADPEEGGTVTVTPLKEEYHMDERVDLVATPAEGWRFAGWHSRYWSDSGRETSVDIYRDMTIEARFVEIEPEGE